MRQQVSGNKKWLVIGVITAVVVGGSYGYYSYHMKTKATSHAGHQVQSGVMTMEGDTVMLDANARALAGVQTAPVAKRTLAKEIRTTGKIAMNDGARSLVTSRIEGRIDELYIAADGQYVEAGQVIASVYSPDLIAAQEEYLLTLDSVQKMRGASTDIVQANNRLLQAAKRKMELLGVTSDEIEHLSHTRKVTTQSVIRSPFSGTVTEKTTLPGMYIMRGDKLLSLTELSTVWMYADIYEKDIASIELGQEVAVAIPSYPGETFTGRIIFVSPIVDDATRTVKVRVEMNNANGKLKPNMFVSAAIKAPLGEQLVIPASALLDTGTRKVVYVAQAEDTFVKRDIVVGKEAEGFIQVISGLQPGETVVTQATFLIDSQTQLGSFGGHGGHGGGAPAGNAPAAPTSTPASSVPAAPVAPKAPPAAPASGQHSGH
jgi:membrane fusion protein, copper/silver efflux system